MTIGTSGFGTANTGGDADTLATVYIDEEGLHLGPNADVFITNEDGVEARVTGSLTHPDISLYGVANAAFEDGPIDPTMTITPWPSLVASNFMPNWRFVQSSGTAISLSQVRDTASPSGSNLRFTVAAGAVADEAYVEQIVPVGGSRFQLFGHYVRATVYNSGANSFGTYVKAQYLDVSGATVGSSVGSSISMTAGTLALRVADQSVTSPPATARSLRIRIGVVRTGAIGNTGALDFTDVRADRAIGKLMLGDITDSLFAPATAWQDGGSLYVQADQSSDAVLSINPATPSIVATFATSNPDTRFMIANGALVLTSATVPNTPGSGVALYPDTSHHLHTLDSDGVDTDLNALKSIILTADFVKTTGTAGTFANLTGLSFPCVSGKKYLIQGFGTYTCSATTGGINLAYNAPAGTVFAEWEVATTTVNIMEVVVRQASADSTNAGAATVNSTASHPFRFAIRYACTANGTFTLRIARTGTVNTVTVEAGSGMFVGVA